MVAARTPEFRLPAVLFADARTASLKVAGLTLLDRLIVAIHRGGADSITIISEGKLPDLKRTSALDIPFTVSSQVPALEVPVLWASAQILVQTVDVRRCFESGGSLVNADGDPLPIGIVEKLDPPSQPVFDPSRQLRPEGIARLVNDRPSARRAEADLWDSLTSGSDGLVDRVFNRPCGRPLSKLLIHTPVSPNTVSIISILIGVVSAVCFAKGQFQMSILGAILFQISAIIDCVDGDIARILFKESVLGKWLDLAGDQIVHVSVFAGITLGLLASGANGLGTIWLGASAVAGALLSFAVVVRGKRQTPSPNNHLQQIIDATSNRDFSVVVFVLACLQRLDLFLWMAAIGSHVFWVTALTLQRRSNYDRRLAR